MNKSPIKVACWNFSIHNKEGSFRTWVLHGMNSKPTQMQNKIKKYEINTAWRRRIQVCACQVWNLNTKVWTYAKKIKWRRNNTSTKIFTGKFHFLSFFWEIPCNRIFSRQFVRISMNAVYTCIFVFQDFLKFTDTLFSTLSKSGSWVPKTYHVFLFHNLFP